jgi:hypothetical protein
VSIRDKCSDSFAVKVAAFTSAAQLDVKIFFIQYVYDSLDKHSGIPEAEIGLEVLWEISRLQFETSQAKRLNLAAGIHSGASIILVNALHLIKDSCSRLLWFHVRMVKSGRKPSLKLKNRETEQVHSGRNGAFTAVPASALAVASFLLSRRTENEAPVLALQCACSNK